MDATIPMLDEHLHILVRLWRWDRIGGRKAACRQDLAEVDDLLDRRLQLTRCPVGPREPAPSRHPEPLQL